MSQQFEHHNIRFIYVALPCKIAVYPEYIADLSKDGYDNVIPQWRKMLYEISCGGVEVLDMYPVFREKKSTLLYMQDDHHISCEGAELVAKMIGRYLRISTNEQIFDNGSVNLSLRVNRKNVRARKGTELCVEKRIMKQWIDKEGFPYLGFDNRSCIGLFGDCNLQAFMYEGGGITAHLAAYLGKDVQYLGRYLPFSSEKNEMMSSVPRGIFSDKKIVIYVGFPSAAFVRSGLVTSIKKAILCPKLQIKPWNTEYIPEEAYK